MNIVYFVLGGSTVIHMQVNFSIRTFLAQRSSDDVVYVVTDSPAMYAALPHVTTIPITVKQISEWRGPHDFFWRVKIKVLQMIAQKSPDKSMIYLDGDTYLYGRLDEIKARLKHGHGMMHLDEGCPGDMKQKSLMMWQTVNGRSYGGVTIGRQHHMWNAGVVAIPAELVVKVTNLALAVCDGMLGDGSEPVVVEQYALSIALYESVAQMEEAKRWIGHYWHYKYYWSRYIAHFFVRSYRQGQGVEDELERIRKTNLKRVHQWVLVKRTISKLLGRIY
jgi:hypothetical protein